MKRLKTFAHRVWISATAPASYAQFLKQNFSAGVKYLYALLLTISAFWVIFGLIAFLIAFPTLRGAFAEIREELPGFYPQELVVTLKDGEISTNVREPYFIDVPKRWEKILAGSDYKHFVAFDTKGNIEDYATYQSVVLVTESHVVVPDKNEGLRVIPLEETQEDFTMNRRKYDQFLMIATPLLQKAPTLLVGAAIVTSLVLPFIAAGLQLAWYMFYLLFAVLIVWVIAQIANRKLRYGQLYHLSLHGLTLPLLVTTITGKIGLSFPFLFSLIFLVWMGAVLMALPKKQKST